MPRSFDRCWDGQNNLVEYQANLECAGLTALLIVSEPRAVATGSICELRLDPVATAQGTDTISIGRRVKPLKSYFPNSPSILTKSSACSSSMARIPSSIRREVESSVPKYLIISR